MFSDFIFLSTFVIFLLFGLVFGSFAGVLIYRLPRGFKIGVSRSRCDDCKTQLAGFDNIPVLSYIMLKGKCRYCGVPISRRYPFFELFVAFLWVLPVLLGQAPVPALVSALFTTALFVIAVVDFEFMIVPDSMLVVIAVLSVPGFILPILPNPVSRLMGAFAAGAFFYLLAVLSEKILKKEGMGGGDIKLVFAAGLILGWQMIALAIGLAAVAALFMVVILRLVSKEQNEDKQIPFAPALTVGIAISHYFGHDLIQWYLGVVLGPMPLCC